MGLKIAEIAVGVGLDVSSLPGQLAAMKQNIGASFASLPGLGLAEKIGTELAAAKRQTEFSIQLKSVEGISEAKLLITDLDRQIRELQQHAAATVNVKMTALTGAGFSDTTAKHFSTQQGLPPTMGLHVSQQDTQAVAVIDRQMQGLVRRQAELESQRTQIVAKFGAQRLAHFNAETAGMTGAMTRTGAALTLPSAGFGRFAQGLQQVSFGAQDFVSVLTQPGMGLGAALRATSNNISQVFTVMGPMTGAVAGLATAVGVSLVSAWLSSGDAAESASEKMKKAADEIEKLNERITSSLDIVNKSTADRRKTEDEGPRTSDTIEKDITSRKTEVKNIDDELHQKDEEAASQRRILAEERKRMQDAKDRGIESKLPAMSKEEIERREKIAIDAEEQARQLRQRRAIVTGEAKTDTEQGVLYDRNKQMGRKGKFEGEIPELEKERNDAKARELPELERNNLTGDKKIDEQLKRIDAGNERYIRKRDEQREREIDNDIESTQRAIESGNSRFRQRREREVKDKEKETTDREKLDRELLPERAKRFADIAHDIDQRKEDIERLYPSEAERRPRMQALAERGERQLAGERNRGAGEKVGITQFTDQIQKGLFGDNIGASAKQTAANTKATETAVKEVTTAIKTLKTGYSA